MTANASWALQQAVFDAGADCRAREEERQGEDELHPMAEAHGKRDQEQQPY